MAKEKCKAKGDEVSPNTGVFRCLKPKEDCDSQAEFAHSKFHVEPMTRNAEDRIINALEHKETKKKGK